MSRRFATVLFILTSALLTWPLHADMRAARTTRTLDLNGRIPQIGVISWGTLAGMAAGHLAGPHARWVTGVAGYAAQHVIQRGVQWVHLRHAPSSTHGASESADIQRFLALLRRMDGVRSVRTNSRTLVHDVHDETSSMHIPIRQKAVRYGAQVTVGAALGALGSYLVGNGTDDLLFPAFIATAIGHRSDAVFKFFNQRPNGASVQAGAHAPNASLLVAKHAESTGHSRSDVHATEHDAP